MEGKATQVGQESINLDASAFNKSIAIKETIDKLRAEKGIFLSLELLSAGKQLLSHNIYWLPDASGQYTGLNELKPATLSVTTRKVAPGKMEVVISNNRNNTVAFFNRISLLHPQTKERITPAFYSDNYITVLPGAQTRMIIEWNDTSISPLVSVRGWNVEEKSYPVK
jgi:hypothetical protein